LNHFDNHVIYLIRYKDYEHYDCITGTPACASARSVRMRL
jgi:hypothetical protein